MVETAMPQAGAKDPSKANGEKAKGAKTPAAKKPGKYDNETKEQKLARLASKRIPAAVKRIKHVGNLAAYGPTRDQADRMLHMLRLALTAAEAAFEKKKEVQESFLL